MGLIAEQKSTHTENRLTAARGEGGRQSGVWNQQTHTTHTPQTATKDLLHSTALKIFKIF